MFVEAIALAFIALSSWFLWDNYWGSKERPPGPLRIPFIGTLIQVAMADPKSFIALDKLSKTYGDVMSIKLGFLDAIVVSSYEAIKELSNREETLGRQCEGMWWDRCLKQNIGVGFSNGKAWADMRKFSKDTLREYGFGKRGAMEALLQDELQHLLAFMEKDRLAGRGRIHFHVSYFHLSFVNVMGSLIMGQRLDYEDPDLQKLLQDGLDFIKNGVMGAGLLTAFPFLRFVMPGRLGYKTQMKAAFGIMDYAKKLLAGRRKENYGTAPKCFVDDFLKRIDEDAQSPNPLFTDDQFLVTFSDIMQGGSETTSNSVNFTLLQLACNPEVQDRMYHEVLEVIGAERVPSIDDKPKMIYTQAVILEGFRWARTLVHGIPKLVTNDFTYRKYKIKKGTVVMSNVHTVFFDEEFWGDPYVFRPERFLDGAGSLVPSQTDRIIPFGAGKRNCFGEVMARDSSFLFLTTLIQKFSFGLPPNTERPSLEPMMGITLSPHAYDAIVEPRNHSTVSDVGSSKMLDYK